MWQGLIILKGVAGRVRGLNKIEPSEMRHVEIALAECPNLAAKQSLV